MEYEKYQIMISSKGDIKNESKIELEHTFINFIPLIIKIKVDLLIGREPRNI